MTKLEAKELTGLDKTLYTTAYNFHMEYHDGATEDSAHEAGIKEINRINGIKNAPEEKEWFVNLSTGKRFFGTQTEMESQNQF
jgi:hypothetical protein